MKKLIRNFSLWLDTVTSRWVVPHEIWEELDRNNMEIPQDKIWELKRKWGCDPEIVRLELMNMRVIRKKIKRP